MVLAAYREAVNIPNMHGYLPIHYAAKFSSADVMKMIAEENMSNMSAISSIEGSVAHFAVQRCSLEHLQYIQSVMPEQLLSVDWWDRTPLHYLKYNGRGQLSCLLSAASDVLRFLLRHCPGLAAAQDTNGKTLYDYLCPSPAVAGGRFVAVSWSAAGVELCRSQGGAAAVPLLLLFCGGAEYLLPHPQRSGRAGADADDRQLLVNRVGFCSCR